MRRFACIWTDKGISPQACQFQCFASVTRLLRVGCLSAFVFGQNFKWRSHQVAASHVLQSTLYWSKSGALHEGETTHLLNNTAYFLVSCISGTWRAQTSQNEGCATVRSSWVGKNHPRSYYRVPRWLSRGWDERQVSSTTESLSKMTMAECGLQSQH